MLSGSSLRARTLNIIISSAVSKATSLEDLLMNLRHTFGQDSSSSPVYPIRRLYILEAFVYVLEQVLELHSRPACNRRTGTSSGSEVIRKELSDPQSAASFTSILVLNASACGTVNSEGVDQM